MSNVTATKPEAKPSNPFKIKEGQRSFLLVPYEDTPRDRVADLLAEQGLLFQDDEERKAAGMPKVVYQIKLSRLTDNDVIFTAVPVVKKMGARKQPSEFSLKVSKAIEVKKFGSADEDSDPNYGAIVDAIQPCILPLTIRVSEDKIAKILTV